ncbi:MAG TPA: tRNA threonylcarbamoyladenosine dehydratase [Bacteroidales bacterium]|nr:tRNA threonylcarbamoyladenosine dehydratase [Bacteroidales bacterium]HPS18130.1 tRNA threonylcarbamoyladenosine dehydratase [Bacteroidales bacterium]
MAKTQNDWLIRTELLVGEKNLARLKKTHILICGIGGVGAAAAEMLCRAGIGKMTLVDSDTIHSSNRNRQIPALVSTEGMLKTEVLQQRLLDINPKLKITIVNKYIKDEKITDVLTMAKYDYVVDAIDTLSPKIYLIYHCMQMKLKLISSLGSGGKFDPSKVQIADISESYNCKLGYYLRKKIHKLGIYSGFNVVFSPEEVNDNAIEITENEKNKKSIVGTISYMPVVFGCFIASAVIREIIEK